MNVELKVGCLLIFAFLVLISAVKGLTLISEAMRCEARWGDFEHRWTVFGGCQVQIDGRWLPEDRIRKLEPRT